MRVIIAGSRSFTDYSKLKKVCDHILQHMEDIEIVSGGARGADKMGENYAEERGYPIEKFPADWKQYNKQAGYIRNEEMAVYADGLIAFWDGESRGTSHMINLAKKHGLELTVVKFEL